MTSVRVAYVLCVLTFGAGLVCCSSGGPAEPTGPRAPQNGESDLKATKPLTDKSFPTKLSRTALRASNDNLPDDLFDAKWQASLSVSPVMFARAYPGAFHADLAQVAASSIPGDETLCFGDAHPDNFGFLQLDGDTRFLYNDLDDAGNCAASVDALRYFAIVRLAFGDDQLTSRLVESYVDGLKDADRLTSIDANLSPSWADVREKGLAKAVVNDRFIPGGKDAVGAASHELTVAVSEVIRGIPALSNAEILDVATLDRTAGGSGGLARYWVLLNPTPGAGKGPKKTIYELKEMATPGTERGRAAAVLDPETRLAELKAELWNTTTERDYLQVELLGRMFLVRNRLAKKSIDLSGLSNDDREGVLDAQVSLLAAKHALAQGRVKKDDLRPWLLESSRVVAERWKAFYEMSGGK